MNVRCICINDSEKPNVIPISHWVKKDEQYTIEFIAYCTMNKKMGFGLSEIYIPEYCEPYQFYDANRFLIFEEDIEKFKELLEECTNLNTLNIEELVQDLEMV